MARINMGMRRKSISELKENFFGQDFMVADYSGCVRNMRSFEQGERGTIEVGAICSGWRGRISWESRRR